MRCTKCLALVASPFAIDHGDGGQPLCSSCFELVARLVTRTSRKARTVDGMRRNETIRLALSKLPARVYTPDELRAVR